MSSISSGFTSIVDSNEGATSGSATISTSCELSCTGACGSVVGAAGVLS